jgi:hypothetical protein
MSFINTIVYGITLGDIFQTAVNTPGYTYSDGTKFSASICSSGGVTFYLQTDPSGNMQLYAVNQTTEAVVSAALPNNTIAGTPGVLYSMNAQSAIAFPEAAVWPASTKVVTGIVNDGSSTDYNVSIPFSNLSFNGPAAGIGPFSLACTSSQLVIECMESPIISLLYVDFVSNRGITAVSFAPISPGSSLTSATSFDIDFVSLGFDQTRDVLSGCLVLQLPQEASLELKHSASKSRPLTKAQKAYFKWLKGTRK